MSALAAEKAAARAVAMERRAELHKDGAGAARRAAAHALDVIAPLRHVRVVAVYLPMRSEIDPTPLMLALGGLGHVVAAPVIGGRGLPLSFRAWRPGAALARGPLGAPHPAEGETVEPDLVVAPLLAFDAGGWRLGYGGGYYDRTLAGLRAARSLTALGFAYAGQEVERVPRGPDDARLDAIVTEAGLIRPA
ncbi:5-formyltetrahydrofolate cyclo-ligase [Amaricoccus sp.]|uniref:5-formyltetrahydrofolate cyclo-ligase n=1 Tax=Amaricoccus sp. TaxID=1872485 RepID=UPI001B57A4BD|nr:5-formyltetrahydrofolate cyclo-ligase [Amaricoccus sp.]MBP7001349.1 5-formyltetrahydrofolate cyclo-ligase [Amaricoccus sp.]